MYTLSGAVPVQQQGKGRRETSCARPAGVGNRNTVQQVTALSEGDFSPGLSSSAKSVYPFQLLSALSATEETWVALFPSHFVVSLPH